MQINEEFLDNNTLKREVYSMNEDNKIKIELCEDEINEVSGGLAEEQLNESQLLSSSPPLVTVPPYKVRH